MVSTGFPREPPDQRAATPRGREFQTKYLENIAVASFNLDSPAHTDNGVNRELLFDAMARAGVEGTVPSGAEPLAFG